MKRKHWLFFATFFLIISIASAVVYIDYQNTNSIKPGEEYKPGLSLEKDSAVNQAIAEYQRQKAMGADFADGPCLTNDLMSNWAADIAHSPRIKADSLKINQCQSVVEKRVTHFVELDPDGNVIRIK